MRHEGGRRHALELGRERRREREDVVDDDVGSRLAQRHARLGGGQDDGLVGLQRSLAGGEDRILGRGHEPHALGLDVLVPA